MSQFLDDAIAACAHKSLGVLDLLRPWVEQNSYSANVDNVNAMGDLLANDFDLDGLELTRHRGTKVGDHLVWTTPAWKSAEPRERLLLVGHHDTVFPPGDFEVWETDGDTLRGPGVLDMKGGIATIQLALSTLAKLGALAEIPLGFVSVGDEEIGSPDSAPLLTELARGAGAALVFEAGRAEDAIITRRKGTGALHILVTGKRAHAGNHHKEGINAIWALAKVVDFAQRCTDYDSGITVNVGIIKGGEARNTVPHHADCMIDFRFINQTSGEALVQKIREGVARIAEDSGATIEVQGGIRRPALESSEASVALCERYGEAATASGLGFREADLIGGGSDASTASAAGVPSIDGLGPRGKGFHTHDEWIEISSLALRAEALLRFIIDWNQKA